MPWTKFTVFIIKNTVLTIKPVIRDYNLTYLSTSSCTRDCDPTHAYLEQTALIQ